MTQDEIKKAIMDSSQYQIHGRHKALYFISWGFIRGACGHKHRTHAAAYKCSEEDREGCKSQGGYSDRRSLLRWRENFLETYPETPNGHPPYTEDELCAYDILGEGLPLIRTSYGRGPYFRGMEICRGSSHD